MADKEAFFVGDLGGTLNLLVGTVAEGGPDLTGSNIVVSADFFRPSKVFDFGLAEDGGSFTDETTALTDAIIKDIDLLPDLVVAINDAFYLLSQYRFASIDFDIGQAGVGNWVLVWEYTNSGLSWSSLPNLVDGTNDFKNAGKNRVTWDFPTDWVKVIVDGKGPFYAVRARVTTGDASPTTQPLGNSARMGLFNVLGAVTDASNGQISISIPAGLFDEPGFYRVQSLVEDGLVFRGKGTTIEVEVKEEGAH